MVKVHAGKESELMFSSVYKRNNRTYHLAFEQKEKEGVIK